ncbi:MAG: hypothetical protein NVS2B12_19280 [Ktedonobacteraceae bacterium]
MSISEQNENTPDGAERAQDTATPAAQVEQALTLTAAPGEQIARDKEARREKTAGPNFDDEPMLMIRGKPVRPWLVLISVIFGFFMALLDATIVNIAIPTIQASLKTDLTSVSWVLSSYNLIFAVLLVTLGRFADQYGRKRLFMISMLLFSLGSLFCALAETFSSLSGLPAINWLIGFRAFQAIGAAGLNPISLTIILATFPRRQRGAAIGVWGALSGLASAAGPVLGGFLVQNFDWRWIFFVNLPFCAAGLVMVALFVPETRDPRASKYVDIPGILTLSVAIFCLVLAIIQVNSWGWASPGILGLIGTSLVSLALFVFAELKQKNPIVDFKLFKVVSFTSANITMFLFGTAIQGAFLLVVLYFISVRNYDQIHAAYALLPIPLAAFVISALGGRLSNRFNPYILGILGMLFITIGFVMLYLISPDAPYIDIAWRCLLLGIGTGMIFQSLPAIALSEIPPARLGVGSGVFNTFRQIGFALGVAVLISVLTGQLQPNLNLARSTAIEQVQAANLPPQLSSGIVHGLQQSGSSASTSEAGTGSNGSGQSLDLTKLADKLPLPEQQKTALRATLKTLNQQISHDFLTQLTNSFKTSWLAAALFAIAGMLSAIVAYFIRRPTATAQHRSQPPEIHHASIG